jgi:hypothetical protein
MASLSISWAAILAKDTPTSFAALERSSGLKLLMVLLIFIASNSRAASFINLACSINDRICT